MDIANVRAGLATAASAVTGLTTYAYVPDSVEVPCFMAAEPRVEYDKLTFGGRGDVVTVTCRVLVSRADDKAGQALLDGYLGRGSASVRNALEAARGAPGESALYGACDDFHVLVAENYRIYEHNGTDYYGVEIPVMCIGEGDG